MKAIRYCNVGITVLVSGGPEKNQSTDPWRGRGDGCQGEVEGEFVYLQVQVFQQLMLLNTNVNVQQASTTQPIYHCLILFVCDVFFVSKTESSHVFPAFRVQPFC